MDTVHFHHGFSASAYLEDTERLVRTTEMIDGLLARKIEGLNASPGYTALYIDSVGVNPKIGNASFLMYSKSLKGRARDTFWAVAKSVHLAPFN
ncbi:hypothetical protein GCM10023184_39980 [Flaviaesturariibacter amylovorans]|uniref:Uncharacterized protein n=1 Tax=Flaviaesturariibacter amylovorans TaxID=1084520 RepID=A0ABP8HNT3_9BACT